MRHDWRVRVIFRDELHLLGSLLGSRSGSGFRRWLRGNLKIPSHTNVNFITYWGRGKLSGREGRRHKGKRCTVALYSFLLYGFLYSRRVNAVSAITLGVACVNKALSPPSSYFQVPRIKLDLLSKCIERRGSVDVVVY